MTTKSKQQAITDGTLRRRTRLHREPPRITLSEDDIDRLLVAVETIEESLAVLAEQQSLDFATYRNEPKT